jgi:hypothetical protein
MAVKRRSGVGIVCSPGRQRDQARFVPPRAKDGRRFAVVALEVPDEMTLIGIAEPGDHVPPGCVGMAVEMGTYGEEPDDLPVGPHRQADDLLEVPPEGA